uniref:DUF1618 domain-containing protein n=1 Tax=Leersia perrieri TaxID=77586 RepID=A0A0D9XBK9_9ORYZ
MTTFHPTPTPAQFPLPDTVSRDSPAFFAPAPLDATAAAANDAARISLDFVPHAKRFTIYDVRHGLVLLLPSPPPTNTIPRLLVLDPASRRRALLPSPPRDAVPDDRWRGNGTRRFIGAALLSRAHPSRLCFEAVCLTVDGDRPRLWLASFRDDAGGDGCTWTAQPRSRDVDVTFDPWWFEGRCVHAAGNIYWHICNSSRLLALDPDAMRLSFLPAPSELGDRFRKYRIGEDEDGRLCIVAMVEQEIQVWVRGDAPWSDNGWVVKREVDMPRALDAVPGMPRDTFSRHMINWVSDIDAAGRSGLVPQHLGLWPLLLSPQDTTDQPPRHRQWLGVWAPHLRLHLGMAPRLPRLSRIFTEFPRYYYILTKDYSFIAHAVLF